MFFLGYNWNFFILKLIYYIKFVFLDILEIFLFSYKRLLIWIFFLIIF
jgi:hypothetical protein